jgi:FlaA1/EpsC-like NDP-sugar epimerase
MFIVYLVAPKLFVSAHAFGIALLTSFLGIASCRFLCVPRTDTRLSRRVLILGVGNRAMQIASLRRRSDRQGVTIVGFVDFGTEPRIVHGRTLPSNMMWMKSWSHWTNDAMRFLSLRYWNAR